MQKPEFNIKPSLYYRLGLKVVGGICVVIIITLPVSLLFKAILLSAVIGYCRWIMQRDNLIIGLTPQAKKDWIIFTTHGHYQAKICGSSCVTTAITVLRFRHAKLKSCVLLPDSLPDDHYRRLLVYLKR